MAHSRDLVTEERLERAATLLAYIVIRHGSIYAPLFDRAERELLEYRRQHQGVMERAERLLRAQTLDGALYEIR